MQCGPYHAHRVCGQKAAHEAENVVEEASERKQSEDCREKNQRRKNGEHKVIRERCRNLQSMVPIEIVIRLDKGTLDTTGLHQLTIFRGLDPGEYWSDGSGTAADRGELH